MNSTQRIVFLWLLLAVCVSLHTMLETAEYVFFTAEQGPVAEGISSAVHAIYIVAFILPLLMAFLFSFVNSPLLRWCGLALAALLVITNGMHLVEMVMDNLSNVTQLALLSLILAINVMLVLVLYRQNGEAKAGEVIKAN